MNQAGSERPAPQWVDSLLESTTGALRSCNGSICSSTGLVVEFKKLWLQHLIPKELGNFLGK